MKTTKEMIEVMQAFVDGKKIEFRIGQGLWFDADSPNWDWISSDYRIKPEPKLRPWKPEEVPVGALIRGKGTVGCSLILSNGGVDKIGITYVSKNGIERISEEGALEILIHSTDNGATWKPCGVEE